MRRFLKFAILLLWTKSFSQDVVITYNRKIDLPKANFFITDIVDARSEHTYLGVVQTGIANNPAGARFKDSLDFELRKLLGKMTTKNDSSAVPVILRVQKIFIYEKTTLHNETGNAEVMLEFYYRSPDGIRLLKSTAANDTRRGIDVTNGLGNSIVKCIQNCLQQLNTHLAANGLTFETRNVFAFNSLRRTSEITDDYEFNIFKDAELKNGVYRSFVEFRNNNPGITGKIFLVERENPAGQVYKAHRGHLKANGKRMNDIWGYSEGDKIFIKAGDEFFELHFDNGYFWFTGYEFADQHLRVKYVGQMLFTAAFTGWVFLTYQVEWTSQRRKYAINMGNGEFFPLED